jgi:hypothetical protein
MPLTTVQAGMLDTTAQYYSFKNRIINGAMVIDQRNNGASVTPANLAVTYVIDRWKYYVTQASKLTAQQNAGSVTPPAGFVNYLGTTSSSAYSVISSDLFTVYQAVEGFNVGDLGWGSANAQTITISFWVRSSLTGTHSGALQNSANTRSYAFTFTVNAANTWEQKTVTIAGDTTGTWLTNNGIGLSLYFNLGAGSTYSTTAGSWQAGNFTAATGSVSVVGTNGATFYITGVQLEKGSTATSFDYRPYGTELALCQRYFQVISSGLIGCFANTTTYTGTYNNPVVMRAAPTASVTAAIRLSDIYSSSYTQSSGAITVGSNYEDSGQYELTNFSGGTAGRFALQYTAGIAGKIRLSSEL